MTSSLKYYACALPLLLLPSTAGIFLISTDWLGVETGYLLGFGFYWLFWCLLVPRWLVRKAESAAIWQDRASLFSRANWLAAFLWLAVTLIAVLVYVGEFARASMALILFTWGF